ncbi:MAG TPA: Hsp20/alpha crystallin family protein [Ktedonobacterales bacterium]|nr:Hsp20/alpha crystallin family protein [Ktedonobacterales bacterium]
MQEYVESQSIPVKVYRSADRLMVAAPMPGLAPEDITVEITADNSIVLDGRLRGALKGVKDLLIDEWSVGDYHRELPLPDAVNGPSANLTYGNGVLVVAMLIGKQTRPAKLALNTVESGHGMRLGNAGRPESDTIVAIDQIDLEASDINDPYSG